MAQAFFAMRPQDAEQVLFFRFCSKKSENDACSANKDAPNFGKCVLGTRGSKIRIFPALNYLARIRTGSHILRVGTGRWAGSSRVCPICSSGAIDNEYHFIFECPTYGEIRCQRLLVGESPAACSKRRDFWK
jgi:hypothetical protein